MVKPSPKHRRRLTCAVHSWIRSYMASVSDEPGYKTDFLSKSLYNGDGAMTPQGGGGEGGGGRTSTGIREDARRLSYPGLRKARSRGGAGKGLARRDLAAAPPPPPPRAETRRHVPPRSARRGEDQNAPRRPKSGRPRSNTRGRCGLRGPARRCPAQGPPCRSSGAQGALDEEPRPSPPQPARDRHPLRGRPRRGPRRGTEPPGFAEPHTGRKCLCLPPTAAPL